MTMKRLVFDIETNGLLEDVNKVWCITIGDMNETKIDSYTDEEGVEKVGTIEEGLERLKEADELIGHNIINYDLEVLDKIYGWKYDKENGRVFDTYVVSRLLNPDRRKPSNFTGKGGPHSLEAWGHRGGKVKPAHEEWDRFSAAMLGRNREDVEINKFTYSSLQSEIKGHNWDRAIDLEHKVAKIITRQERNGVNFDTKRANELITLLDGNIQAIDDQLLRDLPVSCKRVGTSVVRPFKNNGDLCKRVTDWVDSFDDTYSRFIAGPFTRLDWEPINLGSMTQVKAYLLDNGWQPTQWNYNDDGERTSPKLTEDSYGTITGEIGSLIKDRFLYNHRKSQISGWIERVRRDGRITAAANTCGTNTGRFRHSNVVNVPKAKSYVYLGKEMRSLFTCSEGRKMVGHDASGLELRMLAHYLQDDDFTEAVINGSESEGTDIHTLNQQRAGLPTRDDAKTFIYAFLYGAGNDKIGAIVGGTSEDGANLKRKFLAATPSLRKLIRNVKQASKKGWLKGLDGRKVWMRRQRDGSVMEHKALNTLLQSAGAIVMKESMTILDSSVTELGLDATKVLDMHDEAQADVKVTDINKYKELAELSVAEAGQSLGLRVPLAAEAKVGMNWAETH